MKSLSIGGVNFLLEQDDRTPSGNLHPHYRGFVDTPFRGEGAREVRVTLHRGPARMPAGLPLLFSTGEAWSLYADGADLLFVLRPAGTSSPFWTAICDADVNTVALTLAGKPSDRSGWPPLAYPLDQILVMYVLAGIGGMVVHSAGMVIDGQGVLFPGVSGAGKSTLCRVLAGVPGFHRLSDDRNVVRSTAGGWSLFGTPWPGEAGIACNETSPLTGLVFVRKGFSGEGPRRMTTREALTRLLPTVSIPWYDSARTGGILETCGRLLEDIGAWEVGFDLDTVVPDRLADHIRAALTSIAVTHSPSD
jgi:hypothetical protein